MDSISYSYSRSLEGGMVVLYMDPKLLLKPNSLLIA